MQRSWWQRAIIGLALGLALLAAGCSGALKLTYSQGPTLLYWWLDGYVDFDDEQEPRVRQAIDQWFRWNRRDELPGYAQMFARAQAQVLDPVITPQTMCAWAVDVKARTVAAYEQALPQIAELAVTLKAEQLRGLEKRFAKNNAKFRDEYLSDRREARQRALVKKVEERVEMVYGSIDDAQHERIVALVAASPYDPAAWLAERQLLQQEIVQTLKSLQGRGADPAHLAQAQAALRAIARHAERSPRDAYRAQQQRVWDYNCSMTAQIHNAMSPAQRQFASRRLRQWEEDLRSLHAQGR